MRCTKCGRELQENEKFCSECGRPVRTNKKRKKKQTTPFKRFLKVLLIIALVIVGLAVAFVLSAVIAAFVGGDDVGTEAAAPVVTQAPTQAPIVTPAPIETPEPTPEPTPEMTAAVLNYVGSYTADFFKENGVACQYGLPYDDCLCIYMYEDLSFEACKAIGAIGFIDLEDDLEDVYDTVIGSINEFESMQGQKYSVIVMYMSKDEKTIMSYSEHGIDYNIK